MVMRHKNLTFCEVSIAFFPVCEIDSGQAPRTRRCRGGHWVMGQRRLGVIWAAGTLACTAAVHAAESAQRTDPADPVCLQRDAPPEKCVTNDGPPPPPRARGTKTPPRPHPADPAVPAATPTTPAPATGAGAPAGPAATDGARQQSAPRGSTSSGGHPGGAK